MKKNITKPLVTSSLLIAIGLILPYLSSHAFGVPGTILLPMHIPVLLAGLLCGPFFGAACGIIIPVLSSLLTQMPPAFPMLPIMAVQLFAMGLVCGLLNHKAKLALLPSLIGGMLAGQIAYGLMFYILLFATNGSLKALSIWGAILTGLPGLCIQLILIPIIVAILRKNHIGLPTGRGSSAMQDAKKQIQNGQATCVVIKQGKIIHTGEGRGVAPLLKLNDHSPETLKNATVVDKIIGKAAAMIAHLNGANHVYGEIMSQAGYDYLIAHDIIAEYGRKVDIISNRTKTGICPIENSVLNIDDANTGLIKIRETIAELMKNAG